jgi:hypothetical protein
MFCSIFEYILAILFLWLVDYSTFRVFDEPVGVGCTIELGNRTIGLREVCDHKLLVANVTKERPSGHMNPPIMLLTRRGKIHHQGRQGERTSPDRVAASD